MRCHTRSSLLAAVLLTLPLTPAEAQRPVANMPAAAAARLEPTTSTEQARSAFRAALMEAQNINAAGARTQIAAAVSADPQFGLAHAYQAFLAAGNAAERERGISTAIAEMRGAAAPELLLALYWRETAGGRTAVARQLLDILAPLVPGDPEIAYMHVTANLSTVPAERAEGYRRLLERFPQHAAAQNSAAYAFWAAGDRNGALSAAAEYMRLLPQHHNAHDTYADILLLLHRAQDADLHVGRALEITPGLPVGIMKRGTIRLMLNDPAGARVHFAAGRDAAGTFADRAGFLTWHAVSHLYTNQPGAAIHELEQIAKDAQAANNAAMVAGAHEWAGVVEAYIGDPRAVAAHFAAAATAVEQPTAAHFIAKALALARAGDPAQAREALNQLTQRAPSNANIPLVNAIFALDARNLSDAEALLAQMASTNLLANASRAELQMRRGQRREAVALRDEVLASSIKQDGNPGVDLLKLVARLRVAQLR